ncbi:retrovirus-related pol polyprotein from transposon TNT 1-94 [Tanacetum coccineum]
MNLNSMKPLTVGNYAFLTLIMRNKPDIDEIDIDDLYNNLRVYEDELKRFSGSNSASQNLAFLSSKNTGSTNNVNTASGDFGVSTAGGINQVPSTLWHFARECRSGRSQGRRSYGDNGRNNIPTNESSSQALVAQDGIGGYDWSNYFKVEQVNYALMAISSSSLSSSSDSKKAVKERDELKDKIAKWEELTKNLDEILKSQLSARDKTSLGYNTQLNELSSNHETNSENSFSVFDGRSSDEDSTPANDRSSKIEGYKAVPPLIIGNFLTPRADISFAGLDEYAIRNKIIKSQTSKLNNETSETTGQTNDANTVKPKSANDEEEVSEVQTFRHETQTVETRDDKSGQTSKKQRIHFRKVKACFVCESTDHLIKDCNFHDKKSQESNLKNVVNTGKREDKPVRDNTKRVKHQNFSKYPHLSKTFVPSGVLTRTRPVSTARPSIGTARPSVCTVRPVCTGRPSINTARLVSTTTPSISIARPGYAFRPNYLRMDNVRPRGSCSPIKRSYYTKPAFRPKDLKQNVKTFGVKNMTAAGKRAVVNTGKGKLNIDLKKSKWVWRPKGNYLDHVSKDSGSFMLKKVEYVDPKGISKTEFKNHAMNELCAKKGIKREFSMARTPQQNGVAERKNRTLIEAARTMLADSLLPIPFWAEAVNTACYVLNKVLVTKPQNKTPYELLIDSGQFDGKSDEGYLLGYSTSSKAFRVYNKRTKRVEENLHIDFLEDQPNMARTYPNWMFDLDFLTNTMNYIPVSVENQVNVLQMTEEEQVLHDELEKMIAQEVVAKALNDATRQAFEEEKRKLHLK